MKDLNWIRATRENVPEGKVLVAYLYPFFGAYDLEIGTGYFDDPDDYEEGGKGWLDWNTNKQIKVTHFMKLPDLPTVRINANQKEIHTNNDLNFDLGFVSDKYLENLTNGRKNNE